MAQHPNERDATDCPRIRGRYLVPATGEVKPARCGTCKCGWCGPRLALVTAWAIQLANPTWSAVVTAGEAQASEAELEGQVRQLQEAIRELTADLRARGHDWQAVWVIEVSPRAILHAHVLQRGTRVPPPLFLARCRAVGLDWAAIRPIGRLTPLARYVLKGAIAGLDLSVPRAVGLMRRHLLLNGGRLAHSTRDFWTDEGGERLGGVREARTAALRARSRTPQSEYRFLPSHRLRPDGARP
jgi:hypothetical protein